MSTTTMTKSIFVDAPRETVWQFLTEKDKLALWFHPCDADLTQGKPYSLLSTADDIDSKICWGEVLTMNKPTTLMYTFTIKPLGGAMTTVKWTLEDAAGGTRITLQHEGISEAAKDAAMGLLVALDKGWDEHFVKLRATM